MKNIEKVIKDLCRKDREANLRKMGLEPDEGEGFNENDVPNYQHRSMIKLI